MNCSEFDACLVDLVAERGRESHLRAEALSHAKVCSRCEARLADERALAAGLRAWANRSRQEAAPDCAEERLLTRFRELEQVKTPASAPVAAILSQKPAGWKAPRYVGLAASVLLLLGWGLIQWTRETGMDEAHVAPQPKPASGAEEKGTAPAKVMPPPSEQAQKPAARVKNRRMQVSKPRLQARVQHAARTSIPHEGRHEAERAAPSRAETEFLPFMAAGPSFPSEQRQYVRVRLPRSALHVFGLPMNMERAREPVQADVLLSEDGRALAVRFFKD
jgi:hypothetical protein